MMILMLMSVDAEEGKDDCGKVLIFSCDYVDEVVRPTLVS
jgi:hypothetical protein